MIFKKKPIISIMLALALGSIAIVNTTPAYAREQSGNEPPILEYDADEVFLISEDLELNIPFIAIGDEVLLGRLNLEQGQVYKVTVEAAEGISVFVGVRITIPPRSQPFYSTESVTFWSPFSSRGNAGSVTNTITHCGRQGYLYVGSSLFSSFATDLTNVTVRITLLSE